jgi:hypothetical protein
MACIRYLALDNLKRTESLAQQSDDGSEWDDLRRDGSVLLARLRDYGACGESDIVLVGPRGRTGG